MQKKKRSEGWETALINHLKAVIKKKRVRKVFGKIQKATLKRSSTNDGDNWWGFCFSLISVLFWLFSFVIFFHSHTYEYWINTSSRKLEKKTSKMMMTTTTTTTMSVILPTNVCKVCSHSATHSLNDDCFQWIGYINHLHGPKLRADVNDDGNHHCLLTSYLRNKRAFVIVFIVVVLVYKPTGMIERKNDGLQHSFLHFSFL